MTEEAAKPRRTEPDGAGRASGDEPLSAELSRERVFSEAILHASRTAMALCSVEGPAGPRFMLANQAFCSMLGLERARVERRTVASVLDELGMEQSDLLEALDAVARHGEGRLVLKNPSPDAHGQSAPWCIDCSPVRSPEGRMLAVLLEAEQVAAMCQATQIVEREMSQCMDAFLSLAAHELKTPVTSLKGFSQILLAHATELTDRRERRALEAINRQSERLNKLVNDLLDISQLKAGRLPLEHAPVDLSAAVRRVVEEHELRSQGRMVRYDDGEPLMVLGDVSRLEQVVENLISNAVRYSPTGSEVVVTAHARAGRAVVVVADRGRGVPRDQQKAIFRLFSQGSAGLESGGGMGVGLYISRRIVERHGGRLWVESIGIPGEGSRFYISLPLEKKSHE